MGKGDSYVFNRLSGRIINVSLHMRSTVACDTNGGYHNRKCCADPKQFHESPEGLSLNLFSSCPRQSIGLFAGVDLPDYFQGLQIYDGDFVGHADGNVGASAIGGDQNSRCSAS